MKKILVPVDFSSVSAYATEFALQIAEKFDSEVTLLNSVHFDYYTNNQFTSFSGAKTLIEDVHDAMKERMKEFAQRFDSFKNLHTLVKDGSIVSLVKQMTSEEGYDLVVMGTNGSSGLEEALIGSNTEKVVRHADCPVISVPERTTIDSIKKIMVPLDIREIKRGFLIELSKLQKSLDARIEFLWVKTPHNIENEEEVTKELSMLFKENHVTDFEFTIVRNVFPLDGILLHADKIGADMIAMPTHARRGISHWLSGSLTEDTINHIHIPVWSFQLEKSEKAVILDSVKNTHGKAEYKKIEVLTV